MGGWFLSILCTSVAASGLTALLAVHSDAPTLRAVVTDASAWSTRTFSELTRDLAAPHPIKPASSPRRSNGAAWSRS